MNSCNFDRVISLNSQTEMKEKHFLTRADVINFFAADINSQSNQWQSENNDSTFIQSDLYIHPLIIFSASSMSSLTDYNKTRTSTIFSEYFASVKSTIPKLSYEDVFVNFKSYLLSKYPNNDEHPGFYIIAKDKKQYLETLKREFMQ